MNQLYRVLLFASFSLIPSSFWTAASFGQESDAPKVKVDENLLVLSTNLSWQAIQVIRDHHVDPPLRNQMILNGFKRLFPGQARELSNEVEKIQSKDDFKKLLRIALSKYAKLKSNRNVEPSGNSSQLQSFEPNDPATIANAIIGTVPGSPQLVTTYQSKINQQLAENRYVGIGIALQKVDKFTLISVAFRGGPAQKAGVIDGDRILKVDGESMVDKPLGQVVMALRGPKDSQVDVVVSQPGKNERTYKMTRGVVPISSVKGVKEKGETDWIYSFPDHDDVAYLEITDITGSTAAELRTALRQIERGGFEKLVLDFRNCYRADLHHMRMVADVLIAADKLGTWTDANGKSTDLKLRPVNQLGDLPLSVIVSPAQMNEVKLLIAGLIEHRKAQIIGQINPAAIHVRGDIQLASGVGRVENVFIGRAVPSLRSSRTPQVNRQQGRFRSGSREMDRLIQQAVAKPGRP